MKNLNKSTLGFLETYGFVAAVEGLDVALKSANVELVSCEFIGSGIVTVVLTGDVASVKASIEAACTAIDRIGTLRSAHVIARGDEQVWNMLNKETEEKNADTLKKDFLEKVDETEKIGTSVKVEDSESIGESAKVKDTKKLEESKKIESVKESIEINENIENQDADLNKSLEVEEIMKMSKEELEALKVQELRTVARNLKEQHKFSLTKKQIKFSKKDQLVEAILNEQ
ncbi:BMC domain-containing protein [Clostridium sp. MSJ-4]|uniref:BMC domain-containing protein n=1 Tax=Clostridium simiarum TaxID=2841506 RepID=A0ABS6F0K0_9CLOT|nr:BMC domain-containing protein [Clostridium simiarum]MBU5591910.1 BMC domain-containing protein [Clostridium simiarum]